MSWVDGCWEGMGGGGETIFVEGILTVNIEDNLVTNLQTFDLTADLIDSEFTVEIEEEDLSAEIYLTNLEANIEE